ncbi:MAG: zinc ABC transporter substrate-binding protein, partial [Planctomycetaceae bacterium]|nr:zinc ABC transporter substrate-binding protein [Planctomycetaceae bacterium]
DPHLFKTSPGDIQLMQQADAIVYSGLHLEGKMGQVFENLARRRKVLAVAEHLPTDLLLKVDDHFSDPHVWFDVGLWSRGLEPVTALLVEMFPDRKSDLEHSAAEYRKQLDELDGRCHSEIASIPESQRVLITAHDAFHYWGRAYGIEVKAIQGISTESEAGVRQINDLVKFITERKSKAVFVETTVSDRAVLALIEGCSQSGHKITIGGSLFSDAMGKIGTPEGTYVGMVEHNLHTMVHALK